MPRYATDVTRRLWQQRLARFGRSGLAVARFCAEEGVSVASFYNWRKKLAPGGARQRSGDRRPAAFQPLTVVPAPRAQCHTNQPW